MPCYNAAKFLHEAVESVLAQTFTDFELLAIDDGSTDETAAILKDFAAKDSRVRYIQRPNGGISKALNHGIDLATAALIARMDADDICLPERLARQHGFLHQHADYCLVASRCVFIDDAGRERGDNLRDNFHTESFPFGFWQRLPWFVHPSVMMRASVLRQAGKYSEAVDKAEDLDLWLRMLRLGKAEVLPEILLKFRTYHSGRSSTRGLVKQIAPTVAVIMQERARYMQLHQIDVGANARLLFFSARQLGNVILAKRLASKFAAHSMPRAGQGLLLRIITGLGVVGQRQIYRRGRYMVAASPRLELLTDLAAQRGQENSRFFKGLARHAIAWLTERDIKQARRESKDAPRSFSQLRDNALRTLQRRRETPMADRLNDHAFDLSTQVTDISFVQQTFHMLPRLGVFYAECSKNGCTSLKTHLGYLEIGPNRRLLKEFRKAGSHEKHNSPLLGVADIGAGALEWFLTNPRTVKFCMVRNPYARIWSAYNDKIAGLGGQGEMSFKEYAIVNQRICERLGKTWDVDAARSGAAISFDDFLRYLQETRGEVQDRHWHPQWMTMRPDIITYDLVGRTEHLEQDFARLMITLGIHEKYWFVQLLQQNRKAKSGWRSHYDESRARIIHDIYEKDFDTFGYARDSWRG